MTRNTQSATRRYRWMWGVARAFAKVIGEVNTLDLSALRAAPLRSSR